MNKKMILKYVIQFILYYIAFIVSNVIFIKPVGGLTGRMMVIYLLISLCATLAVVGYDKWVNRAS